MDERWLELVKTDTLKCGKVSKRGMSRALESKPHWKMDRWTTWESCCCILKGWRRFIELNTSLSSLKLLKDNVVLNISCITTPAVCRRTVWRSWDSVIWEISFSCHCNWERKKYEPKKFMSRNKSWVVLFWPVGLESCSYNYRLSIAWENGQWSSGLQKRFKGCSVAKLSVVEEKPPVLLVKWPCLRYQWLCCRTGGLWSKKPVSVLWIPYDTTMCR